MPDIWFFEQVGDDPAKDGDEGVWCDEDDEQAEGIACVSDHVGVESG